MLHELIITLEVFQWSLRIIMALVILKHRKTPADATAWLMLVFFLPEVGAVLYLFLGFNTLGRSRTKRHSQTVEAMSSEAQVAVLNHVMVQAIQVTDPDQKQVMKQAESLGGMPTVVGSYIELVGRSSDFDDRLIQDIQQAKHHAHLLFYIYAPDPTGQKVSQALMAAAKRGVICRLMVDAVGSMAFLRSKLAKELVAHGVRVVPCLPVAPLRRKLARLDLRNHRKIAVLDGQVAWTGSQNIVDETYGHKRAGAWVDLMGRFTGPIVNQLQSVFIQDWAYETGEDLGGDDYYRLLDTQGDMLAQCVPTGPGHKSDNFRDVLLTAINASRSKLIITSPYLVLEEASLVAISMAARRGVEVHLVLPHRSDHPLVGFAQRAYYDDLLESGVSIHLYNKGMLHAKTMTVDDTFALLGTANLDIRSFFLNFEINVLLYGQQITHEMRFAQMAYINDSTLLTRQQWNRRPGWVRYVESAAALFSPLL